MERMTDRERTAPRGGAPRTWLLAGASVGAMLAAGALAVSPASGQDAAGETLGPETLVPETLGSERVYRADALAHAGAVEAAWRRLESFIREESSGPVSWTGGVPPAETGWRAEWTGRGLEARYCGGVLLVYLAPERLKGVGRDHRSVHAAPHAYGDKGMPALHWLERGTAEGGEGRASLALPACLSEASSGGPLPSGRAALAGAVPDPFLHTTERVSRERKEEPCAEGTHGGGRTLVRDVTQEHDGRGDPVGVPVEGSWEVLVDRCRADYSRWEHYTLACHWDAGPPHNRRMEGREVWRRLRTVTAAGESLGEPEFVSTSCWNGDALPPAPTPEITETSHEETRSEACPEGYTGSLSYSRTVTLRSTRFPWDEAPVEQTIRDPWLLESDGCVAVPEPDVGGQDIHGDPGGPDGGAGAPGGDGCGPAPDAGASAPGEGVCSADGIGGIGDSGGGDGGGAGDGGGCFLTTAVTERRGEADDGPALTALRGFRDGYMMRTAERRALVEEYYEIAPAIVAAIPAGNGEWGRIAAEVDAAVAAIAAGADGTAFGIYADMVRRLKADWLPAGVRGAGGDRR